MFEEREELPHDERLRGEAEHYSAEDLFNDFGFRTLGGGGGGGQKNGNFLLDSSLPSAFHIDHNANYHQHPAAAAAAGDSRFDSTHIEIEQLVDDDDDDEDASELSGADRTAAATERCKNNNTAAAAAERNCAESMIEDDGDEEVDMETAAGFDEDESEMREDMDDGEDDISSFSSSSYSSSICGREFDNDRRSSAGSSGWTNHYDDSSHSADPISGIEQQQHTRRHRQDQDDYRLQNGAAAPRVENKENREKFGIADESAAKRETNMKKIEVNELQQVSKIQDNDNDYANKANLLQSRSKNVCEFPSKYEKSSNDDPTIGYTNNSDLVNENDELKRHVNASLRNNIDGKIFVCTICLVYSTQRRYYMVNHIKKHLGITNLCCDKCNYTTVWNSDMRRHIRKVHVKRL